MELIEKILKNGDVISFIPSTREYGIAEFSACPMFRRGKLKEIIIWPLQQPKAKYYYKYIFNNPPQDFSFISVVSKGISEPKIWLHFWCKQHKCHSFRMYVPPESNCFRILAISGFTVYFDKR